ncbi:MAG TPA: trypsin-like peptidase domain-containing protein [Candidatus Nitrosotalea sp.]|nr:trypsin-like peptidase domain-containing protein [Candidatus Nitrosotalea sp.]
MDASVEIVKHLLTSVVHIHAEVPSAHPSTRNLGDERMGTGTIVDPAGLILTVNYVVMGAETIQVTLARGRALRAEIVAQDFEIGLALLRVKRQGLHAVQIADSESLERGEPVFALGSTGPRERRVAGGLVTYLGEFEAHWEYLLDRGIVSSASNPGFGGGPLFTLNGKMVGVVSLNLNEIARCSLAIPSECYRRNQEEFVRFGRVVSRPQRAWLGVYAHVLDEGVVVAGLVPNGPAARSGIQEGDVIVSLDAQEMPTRKELYLSLWRHAPGEKMTLEVMRDNEVRRLSVTAGDRADFYKQLP